MKLKPVCVVLFCFCASALSTFLFSEFPSFLFHLLFSFSSIFNFISLSYFVLFVFFTFLFSKSLAFLHLHLDGGLFALRLLFALDTPFHSLDLRSTLDSGYNNSNRNRTLRFDDHDYTFFGLSLFSFVILVFMGVPSYIFRSVLSCLSRLRSTGRDGDNIHILSCFVVYEFVFFNYPSWLRLRGSVRVQVG